MKFLKKNNVKYFSLMELVFALGLLALSASLFCSAANNLRVMDRNFTRESRAVQILDNSIERLSCEKNPSFEDIRGIFEDEFNKSNLACDDDSVKNCEIRNGKAVLEIKRKNGKRLASVEIRIRNPEEIKTQP